MRNSVIQDSGEKEFDNIILAVQNLSVTVRGLKILYDLNFSVERGKAVAIVGPNGAGKTTLFRALMNLIPYTGTIKWSKDVRIGYVPQSLVTIDIPLSVEEFLGFKGKNDLSACLDSVGLEKNVLKIGLGKLSGGELQRVLLAWAIVDNPDVLLFDEPTAFVDIGAEEPIYDKVRILNSELRITTLLISHNLHVVSHYSDYVLALKRKQLFFGETKLLPHSDLIPLMAGVESTIEHIGHSTRHKGRES